MKDKQIEQLKKYQPRASKSQNILVDALCATFSDRYSKK
jgi:hypothetical protein